MDGSHGWANDFDAIEASEKEVIKTYFGKSDLSPYESSLLSNAYHTIQRVRILKEIKAESGY